MAAEWAGGDFHAWHLHAALAIRAVDDFHAWHFDVFTAFGPFVNVHAGEVRAMPGAGTGIMRGAGRGERGIVVGKWPGVEWICWVIAISVTWDRIVGKRPGLEGVVRVGVVTMWCGGAIRCRLRKLIDAWICSDTWLRYLRSCVAYGSIACMCVLVAVAAAVAAEQRCC